MLWACNKAQSSSPYEDAPGECARRTVSIPPRSCSSRLLLPKSCTLKVRSSVGVFSRAIAESERSRSWLSCRFERLSGAGDLLAASWEMAQERKELNQPSEASCFAVEESS